MVQYLIAVATRVNQFGERMKDYAAIHEKMEETMAQVSADMLRVSGENGASNAVVTTQLSKLTEVVRQLRSLIVPKSDAVERSSEDMVSDEMRPHLITLPHIIIDEVQAVLAKNELDKRRQDSMRVRAEKTEQERLTQEDALARKRDLRNARFALYTALGAGVLIELLRYVFTHSF